jgi:hypothetical protein
LQAASADRSVGMVHDRGACITLESAGVGSPAKQQKTYYDINSISSYFIYYSHAFALMSFVSMTNFL